MDLAASIQAVTEDAMLAMGRELFRADRHEASSCWPAAWRSTASPTAGCCARGRSRTSGFSRRPATPAARSARRCSSGISCSRSRSAGACGPPEGQLSRAAFSTADICRSARRRRREVPPRGERSRAARQVVDLLVAEKIVGWFQGRMEFGPRALGARSIIGDPRSPKMQATMNLKIKFRESFRPFAPIVLRDEAQKWFGSTRHESPYMLLVAPVLDEHRVPVTDAQREKMANDPGSAEPREHPAVGHPGGDARGLQRAAADGGRRPQPAPDESAARFQKRTGCPVLVNTSFNVRGEPIVCTPEDAYRCFLGTEMDALVLEDVVLLKEDVAEKLDAATREKYLAQFQLD